MDVDVGRDVDVVLRGWCDVGVDVDGRVLLLDGHRDRDLQRQQANKHKQAALVSKSKTLPVVAAHTGDIECCRYGVCHLCHRVVHMKGVSTGQLCMSLPP